MLRSEDVGTALRELRGSRDSETVAEEAGLSQSDLESYETGRAMPDPDVLGRLLEVLGVSEPDFDRRVLRVWHGRLNASDPGWEEQRQEILEHVQAIGTHLTALVSKLEDRYP